MDELKPCPFDGAPAKLVALLGDKWVVQCCECSMKAPSSDHKNRAVAYWNRRPDDSGKALRKAVKVYQVALGKIDKMRWDSNGASDSRNFIEACMVASKAMEDGAAALSSPQEKPWPEQTPEEVMRSGSMAAALSAPTKDEVASPDPYCVPGPDGVIACPTCAKDEPARPSTVYEKRGLELIGARHMDDCGQDGGCNPDCKVPLRPSTEASPRRHCDGSGCHGCFNSRLDCCNRNSPKENHAPGCLNAPSPSEAGEPCCDIDAAKWPYGHSCPPKEWPHSEECCCPKCAPAPKPADQEK